MMAPIDASNYVTAGPAATLAARRAETGHAGHAAVMYTVAAPSHAAAPAPEAAAAATARPTAAAAGSPQPGHTQESAAAMKWLAEAGHLPSGDREAGLKLVTR